MFFFHKVNLPPSTSHPVIELLKHTWEAKILLSLQAVGFILAYFVHRLDISNPTRWHHNIFLYLFGQNERIGSAWGFLVIVLVVLSLKWWVGAQEWKPSAIFLSWTPWGIAASALLISLAGTFLVFHNYLVSVDERAMDFQARIFAAGKLAAPVGDRYHSLIDALTPHFISYFPSDSVWLSDYLPGFSALKAPFLLFHIPFLINPLFAALTVLLVMSIANRLLPEEKSRHWLAPLFLLASPQFLILSMTGFSMSAHLMLNLLWLWMLWHSNPRWRAWTPWVGVLATGCCIILWFIPCLPPHF
jgi:hypothetical protein